MSARPQRGIAHWRLRTLAAIVATCAVAAAQGPGVDLLLEQSSAGGPAVRGEAALLLIALAPERAEPIVRKVAEDRDARARALALVALGRLAPPGAEVVLGAAFERSRPGTSDNLAAAFALGLLPDSQPVPAVDRYLTQIDGGNYRRHAATLAALLLGFGESPHPSRRASMQRLLEDAANRDEAVRALAVRALACAGDAPDAEQLARQLASTWPAVRLAALDALGSDPARVAAAAERLTAVAQADPDARVRARALQVLVGARQPDAFGLAGVALRARDAEGVAAGVAATTELGGGALRDELVERIAAERDPHRKAAMFGAWRGPVPEPLAEVAFAFATDHRQPAADRAFATHLLAREGDARAIPLLRALLADDADGDTLSRVVGDLARLDADGDLAGRLTLEDTDALRKLAPRLEALFRLGRPEAVELLRRAFDDDRIGGEARAELLRAWRRAVLPPPPRDVLAILPDGLAAVLR